MTGKYRKILSPILLLLLSGSFLFFFSTTTSPLYPNNYGVDSAFYRVIGNSILHGKTLYAEIWDNKGPLLFFIQAAGAVTGTKNAAFCMIFLLQTLSIYITLFFMYKASELTDTYGSGFFRFLLIIFAAFTVLCITMEGGNLCEEWSLPFISCSMYLLALYAYRAGSDSRHPVKYAFIHGICFAAIAFIRINNAVSICAGILVIGIFLILKKQWKNLLVNAAFGILGILTVTIPILVYFYAKGALQEMVYGVFLYNLKYVGDRSHKAFAGTEFLIRYLPIILSFLLIALHLVIKRSARLIDIMMLAIVSVSAAMLWPSNEYLHYFTIMIPVFILILVLYLDFRNIPGLLLVLAAAVFFIRQDMTIVSRLPEIRALQPKYPITARIPEEEKKISMSVWTSPDVYLNTGFEPCTRFCAYQFIHFPVDPEMLEEYLNDLKTKQPMWVMVLSGYEGIYPEVEEILKRDYQFVSSEDNVDFFRRIIGKE